MYATVTYTGNGSTIQFGIPFPYLDKNHISVTVDRNPVSFTWVSSGVIQLTKAPASGAKVKIHRNTSPGTRLVDFADGSSLDADTLDEDSLQSFYRDQELQDLIPTDTSEAEAYAAAAKVSADASASSAANAASSASTASAKATEAAASAVSAAGAVSTASSMVIAGKNRIINGDFRVNQYGTGSTPTASTYVTDRWVFALSQPSKVSYTTVPSAGMGAYASISVASVFEPGVDDYFAFRQNIEGINISDFQWGLAGAKAVTLSFRAFSTIGGTYSVIILNGANSRCYGALFTLGVTTWKNISITIPGDTAGTWPINNSAGLVVSFSLGCGTNKMMSAGSWQTGAPLGVTGQNNLVGQGIGATLLLADVQLEVGSVATAFERLMYPVQLAMCQRYYQKINSFATKMQATAAGVGYKWPMSLPVPMRAAPTATLANTSYYNSSSAGVYNISASSFAVQITATAASESMVTTDIILSAEL